MATFSLNMPEQAGVTGLTATVRRITGSTVNSTPAVLTEGATGVFTATIAEALDGVLYKIEVKDSGSTLVATLTYHANSITGDVSIISATAEQADGGYEFTGGFVDRTTGAAGASDQGSNTLYTQDMVNNQQWLRFGFDATQQATNDDPYWSNPAPSPAAGIGLFGGDHMPAGVTSMFDFSPNDALFSPEGTTNEGESYTAANGSFDFSQCVVGDLALVRFDFNVLPQIANTTLEVALIWQNVNTVNNGRYTFALTGEPQFYGTGTVGRTFLARPLISAYFASQEDVDAKALLAIRADNPIQIQPLTTLSTIQR